MKGEDTCSLVCPPPPKLKLKSQAAHHDQRSLTIMAISFSIKFKPLSRKVQGFFLIPDLRKTGGTDDPFGGENRL